MSAAPVNTSGPEPVLRATCSRRELSRWLISRTRKLLPPLWISVAAAVTGQLLGVALFVLGAIALARAVSGELEVSVTLVWVLVGLALVKALLFYLEHYAGHWVAFTALQRLRELYFESLVPQAPAATQGQAGAELTERATRDIDRIEVFFAHSLPPAVASIAVPTIALTWLGLGIDWRLALAIAPFALLLIVLPVLSLGEWRRHMTEGSRDDSAIATNLGDNIQGVREILAFDAAAARLAQLGKIEQGIIRRRDRTGRSIGFRTGLATFLKTGSLIAVFIVAGVNDLPLEASAIGLAVAVSLWLGTGGIDDFVSGLDVAFAATERIREVIEGKPLVTEPAAPRGLPATSELEFQDVTFTYPGAHHPSLRNVSLRIEEGSWSYLTGVSGSGKSTLAQMLLRGWDPDQGEVTLGGVNVEALSLHDLRGAVGYVSQRPTTLSASIADNLRLAAGGGISVDSESDETAESPVPDNTELMHALDAVDLGDWARALPDGLNTELSERGLDVSGGQLQRLALARALLARPRVLVLDEALSQLDHESAIRVRRGVAQWRQGMTVIEVTHRTDLIADTSAVAVIDSGCVVEQGTAHELRNSAGPFVQLASRAPDSLETEDHHD